MAAVFGIQLVPKLNTSTTRRTFLPLRFDLLLDRLQSTNLHGVLYRALDFNPVDRSATVIQTYPPLNAWSPHHAFIENPLDYRDWTEFIHDRALAFVGVLTQRYPLTQNAQRYTNPLVLGAAFGDFLNARSIDIFLDRLFYDPTQDSPITAITKFPYQWTIDSNVTTDSVRTSAGCKYITLYGYDPSRPSTPATYGKHRPTYATVFYYSTLPARSRLLANLAAGPTVLEHFDSPTYGPHLLLPQTGDVLGYSSSLISQAALLMVESVMDALRDNANASASTAVTRLDQSYHPVTSFDPSTFNTLLQRATNLALLAVQGVQSESAIPAIPTMSDVRSFVARLMAEGDPQQWFPYRVDQILYWPESPFVPPIGPFYAPFRPVNFPFTTGSYTVVPDASRPLRLLPQYRNATITVQQADDAYEDTALSPLITTHGFCVTGGVFTSIYDISGDPTAYPPAQLVDAPNDYFDRERMARRDLFRRLRAPADRSAIKDRAVFDFLASLVNPTTANPVLDTSFSMAYLGASSAHANADEPVILADIRSGSIPGLPIPRRIVQFGYDVVHGSLLDLSRAVPTGTFGLVYADLDQVEDAGTDMPAANRAAIAMLGTALQMTTAGGVSVLKVNFPTRAFWTQVFNLYATHATTLHLVKPTIVNSSEVFLVFGGRQSNGALRSTTALQRALLSLYARNAAIDRAVTHIPFFGVPDDGTSDLGIDAVRLFDPMFSDAVANLPSNALASLVSRVVPSSIMFTRVPSNGPVSTTIYGKRTFLSNRRRARLRDVPMLITTTLVHQRRFTTPPTFTLFSSEAVPVTTLVAAGYNSFISEQTRNPNLAHLLDLGTGPECRILSLIPPTLQVTMSDSRPCAELMASFDPALTAYVQGDYSTAAFWNGIRCDSATAIFTIGAAAAAAGTDLIAFVQQLIPRIVAAGGTRMWLQLNTPLYEVSSLPDLIEIDLRDHVYRFNGGERVEPYADPVPLQQAIAALLPAAALSWHTLSPTCDWLPYIIGVGSPLNLSDINTAISYSRLTPILHIDTTTPPLRVNPVPTPLNQQCAIRITSLDPAAVLSVQHNGVEVIGGTPGNVISVAGAAALQYILANQEFLLQFTPTLPGIFDVFLTTLGQPPVPRGSFTITPPPTTVALNMPPPRQLDFTDVGNDARITCDPYYQLAVCIFKDGQYVRVNPEKASVVTNAPNRDLHFVLDLADNHVLLYLCDVTPSGLGDRIAFPIVDIYRIAFPRNTPVRASLPYTGGGAHLTSGGNPFMSLTTPPAVLPAGVALAALSTSVATQYPTYTLPAGVYEYVIE
ncbi:VP1 [Grass carp reovirus]|uniref:VP1 n=1 Tax=Grass carp reovirus TaxID=128987 RepID=A0ABF7PFE2_GCRV|nr:VP1 [Grass carp reovirus]3IYL_W Chain W, VP1 [Grass carp reovirus]3K1Q_A Chain A, VP1 [Grass carp reovirus]5ZVT_W Chain W, VP1 [Grass carp reovirus]